MQEIPNQLDNLPTNFKDLPPQANTCLNVMEILVKEEIERQIKAYLPRTRKYINKIEVASYALNQLPALYATSQEGKVEHYRKGKKKYKKEIISAVRRAFAKIEQNPLRTTTPLVRKKRA